MLVAVADEVALGGLVVQLGLSYNVHHPGLEKREDDGVGLDAQDGLVREDVAGVGLGAAAVEAPRDLPHRLHPQAVPARVKTRDHGKIGDGELLRRAAAAHGTALHQAPDSALDRSVLLRRVGGDEFETNAGVVAEGTKLRVCPLGAHVDASALDVGRAVLGEVGDGYLHSSKGIRLASKPIDQHEPRITVEDDQKVHAVTDGHGDLAAEVQVERDPRLSRPSTSPWYTSFSLFVWIVPEATATSCRGLRKSSQALL